MALTGFLEMSCVNHVADGTINTRLKEIIKHDFCVDDCFTGAIH